MSLSVWLIVAQGCAARIKATPGGDADCESWYFDYYKCLDKWVS